MKITIDTFKEEITVGETTYSLVLFGGLSFAPVGTVFRIVSRENGVVTLENITLEEQRK